MLIICAPGPRNTPSRVSFFFSLSNRALLMRIVQMLDCPGLNRTAFTLAIAEWTHSAAIFISFAALPFRQRQFFPIPLPAFQSQIPASIPKTDLPPCLAQTIIESDVRMAIVPVFNHSSSISVSLVPATETYVNNPARSRYFDFSFNSHGSVYPTIQKVSARSVYSLASTLKHLSHLGRQVSCSLTPAEMPKRGGTITVSNVGAIGDGDSASPVLVPGGGVAIVAVGRAKWVWDVNRNGSGQGARRLKVRVSWSADRRVVEGAELAAFVGTWRGWVESHRG